MEHINLSNYQFNIQAVPVFIVGLFMVLAGAFVFSKDKSSVVNRMFFYICLSVGMWLVPTAFGYSSVNREAAIFWFKIDNFSVLFISINVFMFIKAFLEEKISVYDRAGYFLILMLGALLIFSDLLISDVYKYFWGYFPKWKEMSFILLIVFFGYMAGSFSLLLKKYKKIDPIKRNQARYIFLAFAFAYTGSVDILPTYGFQIYPFGFISISIFLSIIGYAIVKHQLMDIELVVRRTAVFAGLFAFVYGTFSVVTIIGQEFFKNSLGWNQWTSMIPTVLIITSALRPLENFLTNATEKFLFQKKYDYRVLLKTFTNEVLTVLDIQQLPHQTVAGLIRILKLESASILLHEKDLKLYKMAATIGVKEKEITFDEGGTFITYIKAANHPILKDKAADKIEGESPLKDSFKKLNAQLCLPVLLHDDLIGVLALGAKKSGEDFTQEDIDILDTLARTEAIAISNARLFDELSKTQAEAAQREKMAVIGTLAAGINHEICNPLGIVRGQCEMFLLNYRDAFYKNKTQEEVLKITADVMNKVIKETDRATAITKKLSGFAKPSKKDEMMEVYVQKELEEVISLIGHDLELSNIEFRKDFPQDFPAILADHKQVQEILFNIIRNAAQAMDKKDGRIIVSGFSQNGAAIVRIADNGSGIPPDKIGQIFNPFYTTKAPGKGTGLGLFIVKQVVEKNRGTIAVESDAGIGTTFTLRFPVVASAMVQAA